MSQIHWSSNWKDWHRNSFAICWNIAAKLYLWSITSTDHSQAITSWSPSKQRKSNMLLLYFHAFMLLYSGARQSQRAAFVFLSFHKTVRHDPVNFCLGQHKSHLSLTIQKLLIQVESGGKRRPPFSFLRLTFSLFSPLPLRRSLHGVQVSSPQNSPTPPRYFFSDGQLKDFSSSNFWPFYPQSRRHLFLG